MIEVNASGITAFGISAPFWGLAAGLLYHGMRGIGFRRSDAQEAGGGSSTQPPGPGRVAAASGPHVPLA